MFERIREDQPHIDFYSLFLKSQTLPAVCVKGCSGMQLKCCAKLSCAALRCAVMLCCVVFCPAAVGTSRRAEGAKVTPDDGWLMVSSLAGLTTMTQAHLTTASKLSQYTLSVSPHRQCSSTTGLQKEAVIAEICTSAHVYSTLLVGNFQLCVCLCATGRPMFCFCHSYFTAVDMLLGDKPLPKGLLVLGTGVDAEDTAAAFVYTTG